MFSVKIERAVQTFAQRYLRLPSQDRADAAEIGVIIPDVNSFAIRRVRARDELAAAVRFDQQLRKLLQTDDAFAAQIEYLTIRGLACSGEQKGVNRVVLDITSKPPGTIEWE